MAFPISGSPIYPPTASPAYTGIFIPELWSSRLIEKFYDATVLAAISNTFYEGDIAKMGDKVHIRTVPTLTIRAYSAEQSITYERPSSGLVDLLIDKAYYFGTTLDDVLRHQSDLGLMDIWAEDASEQMKIVIDGQVLSTIPAGVVAANKGATAGRKSGDINLGIVGTPRIVVARGATTGQIEMMDLIVDMGTVLDEQNIPETNRWLLLPPAYAGMLKKGDLRNAQELGDDTSVFRNGRLGMLDRFTVYSTNLLPTAVETTKTATHIFAGHSVGLTFASQLTEMETLRSEQSFANLMRGLQVYGTKVIDGTALVDAYCVRA